MLVVGRSFFVSFWVNEDETKVGGALFIIKKAPPKPTKNLCFILISLYGKHR